MLKKENDYKNQQELELFLNSLNSPEYLFWDKVRHKIIPNSLSSFTHEEILNLLKKNRSIFKILVKLEYRIYLYVLKP